MAVIYLSELNINLQKKNKTDLKIKDVADHTKPWACNDWMCETFVVMTYAVLYLFNLFAVSCVCSAFFLLILLQSLATQQLFQLPSPPIPKLLTS